MNINYRSGQADNWRIWYPKITFSGVFCGFLRNRSWTSGARLAPNTHPRPHLMQNEPTDFLNLPKRGTVLGVQNVTMYCKIDTVIQSFHGFTNGHWPKGYEKLLTSCFYIQKNPRYQPLKNQLLYSALG